MIMKKEYNIRNSAEDDSEVKMWLTHEESMVIDKMCDLLNSSGGDYSPTIHIEETLLSQKISELRNDVLVGDGLYVVTDRTSGESYLLNITFNHCEEDENFPLDKCTINMDAYFELIDAMKNGSTCGEFSVSNLSPNLNDNVIITAWFQKVEEYNLTIDNNDTITYTK